MRIAEVYVDGFKNIVDTRIAFDDITCLISQNNYGKSNLLFGILNGFRFLNSGFLNPDSFFDASENVPLLKSNYGKDFSFEVVLKDDEKSITYGYSYAWARHRPNAGKIIKEYLKVKPNEARKARTYIDRTEPTKFRFLLSSKSSSMEETEIAQTELAFNKLWLTGKAFFQDILGGVESCSAYIDSVDDTSVVPVLDLAKVPVDSMGPFKKLKDALADFMNAAPKNKEHLIDAMKLMFPDLQDITARKGIPTLQNDRYVLDEREPRPGEKAISIASVRFKNYDVPLDLAYTSTGFKRILAFLMHVFQAQTRDNVFLAIEEPENSIHLALLESFIECLQTINEHATILLSSHSPFIVNSLDPASVYVGLPHGDGTASFAPFKKSKEKAMSSGASDFGLTIGSYIFELLGGDDYLKSILASYLDK